MTEPASEKPKRRPRYRGKNPRHFHEKYKEHSPEQYADDVAKVVAGGKTPAGMHRPIMVSEILEVLAPKAGEVVLDCTLGYGGHAGSLLAAVQPGGRLLGVDADPIELPKTEARLRCLGFPPDAVVVRRMNYAAVAKFIAEELPGGADMVLADLGLSSMQIDDPARGFTYKVDGPLDMRMNPSRGLSASEWLSTVDEGGLVRALVDHADEPRAGEIARAILLAHTRSSLTTTGALAKAISADDDTVRRVFQAIRIAVNNELSALEAFLRTLPFCLKPGGRVAVLTFHSGEDRRVKAAFKDGLRDGVYTTIAKDVVRASSEERRANPRSTSAKLRYAVRGAS